MAIRNRMSNLILLGSVLAGCAGGDPALTARVTELEAEVHALQAQLAAGRAKPVDLLPPDTRPLSQAEAARALAPPPAAPRFDDRFAVHLASYRNAKDAAAGWRAVKAKYPALNGLEARLSPVDLGPGKGVFYRLKAGPLADEAAAKALCAKLRSQGQGYCNPADFTGTAVAG